MTPAQIAAVRVTVQVRDDDKPGTLSSLLARLERLWREGEQRRVTTVGNCTNCGDTEEALRHG